MRLRLRLFSLAPTQLFIVSQRSWLRVKVQIFPHILNEFLSFPLHVLSEAVNLGPRHIIRLAVSPNLLNISKNLLEVLILPSLYVFLLKIIEQDYLFLP